MTARHDKLVVGRISGLHGVNGWIKVFSYTDPPNNIFEYRPWLLDGPDGLREATVVDTKQHGSVLIAKLDGVADRDNAALLVDTDILVLRKQLPPPDAGEYYWADLVGLDVITTDGELLGTVERMFETGANDVMVVTGVRERLIPWIVGDVIDEVDLSNRRIKVSWDPEF
ncbi:MAG: ribosome maturation factor RimM [Gammaproteobacteria bacterium]|nr:ribosome maturation factor RimM [Gammaproteobacteria bacterium]MDH3768490.1 ribosome maturation factor RimM [Gammaproteobacteria bacterium]